jgi:hypothetical protein
MNRHCDWNETECVVDESDREAQREPEQGTRGCGHHSSDNVLDRLSLEII